MSGGIAPFTPYIATACLLLAFAVARSWHLYDRSVDRCFATVLILCCALVAGNNDLGTDAPAYREFYDQLTGYIDRYTWWDPAFEFFATLFAAAGAPYGLFVFVCVLASHSIKLLVYDQLCENRMLVFFMLFCFDLCEIAFVRQYLAASLLLLSFLYLTRNKIVPAALAICAAALFHKSVLLVGVLMFMLGLGRGRFLGFGIFVLISAAAIVLLPQEVLGSVGRRVLEQISAYADQDYVQGFESGDIALLRNLSKFVLYVAIAVWMLMVPAKTPAEAVQQKAGVFVLAVSVVSIGLIIFISPVFARMSTYIFPFLALSLRTERFRLVPRLAILQYALVTALIFNLVVSIYPLINVAVL